MSDSLGKAVYEAADNGNEAELRRLIKRGGGVNWHNPEVRRRMCLAWAPASSPPLLLRSPSTRQRPPCAVSPQPRRRWPFAAAPPPAEHASSPRAAPPRAPPRSSRFMALVDSVVLGVPSRATDSQLS